MRRVKRGDNYILYHKGTLVITSIEGKGIGPCSACSEFKKIFDFSYCRHSEEECYELIKVFGTAPDFCPHDNGVTPVIKYILKCEN